MSFIQLFNRSNRKIMNYLEVMTQIVKFQKGAGCIVVTNKLADMKKGRGDNRNPFIGRVIIEKVYSGYVMGTDYVKSIENAAARMGNTNVTAKPKKVWHKRASIFGDWFNTDKATESKFYLKLMRNEKQIAHKVTTTYYLDGRLATDAEVAAIESWMPTRKHTISSTQREIGIDDEHKESYILPQLDTITLIKQGDREFRPAYALVPAIAL